MTYDPPFGPFPGNAHLLGAGPTRTDPPKVQINTVEPVLNNPVQGLYPDIAYDPATHTVGILRVGGMDVTLQIAAMLLAANPKLPDLDPFERGSDVLYSEAIDHADNLVAAYRKWVALRRQKP